MKCKKTKPDKKYDTGWVKNMTEREREKGGGGGRERENR